MVTDKIEETKRRETTDHDLAIENKLHFASSLMRLEGSIKNEISNDFVKARFGEKRVPADAVVEVVKQAYYVKTIIEQGRERAFKRGYSEEVGLIMQMRAIKVFDSYMKVLQTIAATSINVTDNPMIDKVLGFTREEEVQREEQIDESKDQKKILKDMKKMLKQK